MRRYRDRDAGRRGIERGFKILLSEKSSMPRFPVNHSGGNITANPLTRH